MSDFTDEILADIEWRASQLSTARILPFRYSISVAHRDFLIGYTVPIIYAVWEGFVRNSFEIYVRELNSLGLERNQFCINIISHTLEMNFPQFKSPPKNYTKLAKFFKTLNDYFEERDFRISSNIPTDSNVNLEVINNILLRFNLEPLPDDPHRAGLNKLLQFRNSIAHGDRNILVTASNISEFALTVINLMHEVFLRINEGYIAQSYLNVE